MQHEIEAPLEVVAGTNITLSDERFHCAVVTDPRQLQSCFRLRHWYYVSQKRWVAPNACLQDLEQDAYDERALHLAVFEADAVVAYLRVLPHTSGHDFMLDRDFCALLPENERHSLVREGAAELSRFVCRYDFLKGNRRGTSPIELLFKLFYRVSRGRGLGQFYIVVEEAWIELFARRFGLSFHVIGQPHTFPDGTRTVAATATLEELESAIQRHDPRKWAWYDDKG